MNKPRSPVHHLYIYEHYEFCHPDFTCGYCCTCKWHWCDQSKSSWESNIDSGKIISIEAMLLSIHGLSRSSLRLTSGTATSRYARRSLPCPAATVGRGAGGAARAGAGAARPAAIRTRVSRALSQEQRVTELPTAEVRKDLL